MFSTREDQGLACMQTLEHFNTPLIEEVLLVSNHQPLPPNTYFQTLKCFLSLDTTGKFWKIPQEGEWAKRAPFLMPFRKH